jgi:hypothetical protein
MSGCAGLTDGGEVVEHDRATEGEPAIGGIEGWIVSGLLSLAAAIQDRKVERPMAQQLSPSPVRMITFG